MAINLDITSCNHYAIVHLTMPVPAFILLHVISGEFLATLSPLSGSAGEGVKK